MHLFYFPDIHNNLINLPEEESRHAIKVLRLGTGYAVQVIDGKGGFYETVIREANPKKCVLEIVKSQLNFGAKPYRIHIALAPTKNIDRVEWFVEKATEIGIDEITFLQCERSERKNINLDRLDKIVISGIKQSLKAYKPILNELVSFKDYIKTTDPNQTYIAHLEDHNRLALHQIDLKENMCILIGPEGDFTPKEIEMAYAKGIKPVTLGEARLRTETAALVACHTLNLLHEMKSV